MQINRYRISKRDTSKVMFCGSETRHFFCGKGCDGFYFSHSIQDGKTVEEWSVVFDEVEAKTMLAFLKDNLEKG
jgi:hypothetical protein